MSHDRAVDRERTVNSAEPAPRWSTLRLLGALQAGQYLPINFLHITLVVILRERGASLSQLAAVNAVAMLLAVKILWAPLLDRYGSPRGHYRSWLLVLQPLMALAIVAMLPLDPVGDFGLLVVTVVVVVQLAAMQDVASDALAIRAVGHDDRGVASGVRLAGGYLGHVLGGGAVLFVYSSWGWHAAVASVATLTILPLWQLAHYREPSPGHLKRPGFRAVASVFRQPGVVRWAVFRLPLNWIGAAGGYALVPPMLVDAGWPAGRIGFVAGILGSVVGAFAAACAGLLVSHFGRTRVLALACGAKGLVLLTFGPLALGQAPFLPTAGVLCLFGGAYAVGAVAVNAILMDLTRRDTPASDFTALTSVGFLVSLSAGGLSVAIADHTGYLPVLLGAAALVILAAAVNARLDDPPTDGRAE